MITALVKLTILEPQPNGDYSVVKVKTRLNIHGVLSFEQAYVEEIEEKEEAMNVDGEEQIKKKKIIKKKDVPFVWSTTSLDSSIVEQLKQQEADMHAADKLVADTEVSLVLFYEIQRMISDCLSCDI